MAVDAGLTIGGAAAASLLWKVIRHPPEVTLKEAEGAALSPPRLYLCLILC